MIKIDIKLPIGYCASDLKDAVSRVIPVRQDEIKDYQLVKRSLVIKDSIHYNATVALSLSAEREEGLLKMKNKVSPHLSLDYTAPEYKGKSRPVVVGSGPCGLFAALVLAESGARPIVLERGLKVEERIKKVNTFATLGILDPECNVQFGEGGAGTYSDGKLKVGSHDKYKMKVLREFVSAGANGDILFSTSAHLGTDKLSDIVKAIRKKIESLGGSFIYSARLTDVTFSDGRLSSLSYEKEGSTYEIEADSIILATGHSARDVFEMLNKKGVPMQAKGFGIGLRIEHPREYINSIVYKEGNSPELETASYHLVTHLKNGRSVYSFCMCPGGTVVAAASEEGAIVTNGMSKYARDGDNSNAAFLVSVTPQDFPSDSPLAGILLQRAIEKRAYDLSCSYRAPTSSMEALIRGSGKATVDPTYPVGTVSAHPSEYLPAFIVDSLAASVSDFDSWLDGFYYGGAALTGPETRTTSPVRIQRGDDGYVPGFVGLFPAGEGAGYAGGIVSSAVDGIRSAEALIGFFTGDTNG